MYNSPEAIKKLKDDIKQSAEFNALDTAFNMGQIAALDSLKRGLEKEDAAGLGREEIIILITTIVQYLKGEK